MWGDWMDFDRDGEVDSTERMLGEELPCTSREEHRVLFGDDGDFGNRDEDEDSD